VCVYVCTVVHIYYIVQEKNIMYEILLGLIVLTTRNQIFNGSQL
jgi:hypothetical protein